MLEGRGWGVVCGGSREKGGGWRVEGGGWRLVGSMTGVVGIRDHHMQNCEFPAHTDMWTQTWTYPSMSS